MRICCKCKIQYSPNDLRSFHAVPKDKTLRKRWLDSIGMPEADVTKTLFVCSDHFDDESYYNCDGEQLNRKLRVGALPTCSSLATRGQSPIDTDLSKQYNDAIDNEAETALKSNQSDNLCNLSDMLHNECKNVAQSKDSSGKFLVVLPIGINVDETNVSGFAISMMGASGEKDGLTCVDEELDIKEECISGKKDYTAKRKVETQCNWNKRFKVTGGRHTSYLSRRDFSSDEAWTKFTQYKEMEVQRATDRSCLRAESVPKRKRCAKLEDIRTVNVLKVCRGCLATDCRMYSTHEYQLIDAYQLLTGLQIKDNDKLPSMLCVECAHRLANYSMFREKCLRANELMLEIQDSRRLTLDTFRNVDRHAHNLTLPLTSHVYVNSDQNETFEVKEEKRTALENEILVIDNEVKIEDNEKLNEISDDCINQIVVLSNNDDLYDDNIRFDDFEPILNASAESLTEFPTEVANVNLSDTETKDSVATVKKGKSKISDLRKMKGAIKQRCKKARNVKDSIETMFDGKIMMKSLTHDEQLAEVLKRKDSDNYKNANFTCDKCYRGFLSRSTFEKHMIRHTDASGAVECSVCYLRFPTSDLLRHHTLRHKHLYTCKLCDFFTNSCRSTAISHYKWHKGVQYECPHCKEVFKKTTTYLSHLRIKHPSDFICQLCGYSFISQKGVLAHQKMSHQLDGTKQEIPLDGPCCATCNIQFASTDAYDTHLKISAKHSATDQRTDIGGKRRNDYNQWRVNQKSKGKPNKTKKPKTVPCEQCGEMLQAGRAYYQHFRVNHPGKNRTCFDREPFMCEVCGKVYRCAALLKEHMLVHSGAKFACDVCGKVLASKHGVKMHMSTHLSTSRAQCNVCGKYYSSVPNMRRHRMIHSGVKPFKCDTCHKAFRSKEEKVSHEDHVHLKKPWPKRERGKRTGARRLTRQEDELKES